MKFSPGESVRFRGKKLRNRVLFGCRNHGRLIDKAIQDRISLVTGEMSFAI